MLIFLSISEKPLNPGARDTVQIQGFTYLSFNVDKNRAILTLMFNTLNN